MSIEFLRTEAETAFGFAKIASDTPNQERRRRNVRHARRAYDTLLHFLKDLVLTANERDEMQTKVAELHRQLVALGETL